MPPELTASDSTSVDLSDLSNINPTVKTETTKVQPAAVTKLESSLPWNSEKDTTMCGQTIVGQNGDDNYRITMEGVIHLQQLNKLKRMREEASDVKVISDGYTGKVQFDQFTFTRVGDEDRGSFKYNGETITSPLYTFQLQSKEKTKKSGLNSLFG